MIRIIIALILTHSIYSTFDTCIEEEDASKCQAHDSGISNGFCYHIKTSGFDSTNKEENTCFPCPETAQNQKLFWKIFNGMTKEMTLLSSNYDSEAIESEDLFTIQPKKDYYAKGEIVEVDYNKLPKEELLKVNKTNICMYHHSRSIMNEDESNPVQNITNQNICFNAEKFNDLKNIFNCGHAKFTYFTKNNNSFVFYTCYYIPDKQMPESMNSFYKQFFFDTLFYDDGEFYTYEDKKQNHIGINKLLKNKIRKLDDNEFIDYEVIIEDKYGKKIKFNKNSESFETIEKGNQKDSDREETDDDEPTKIKTNSSIYSKLNIILLLSLIFMTI